MPIPIITQRQRIHCISHSLIFDITPGSGFAFDCDASGQVNTASLGEDALANYERCRNDATLKGYVATHRHSYIEDAVGRCECGASVRLRDPLTNHCACGRAYNMAGQEVIANYTRADCLADGCAWDEDDY